MFAFRRRRPASNNSIHRPGHVARKHRGLRSAGVGPARMPVEQLESRLLLTFLTGGGPGITNAGPDHEFLMANNQVIRIAMRGNVEAEFIGVYPAESDADPPQRPDRNVVTDLVPPPPPGTQNPIPGADIFMIYITRADLNSSISIATVPPPAQGNTQPRRMQPFTSSPGDIRAVNARTGDLETVTFPGSPGGVYIGSRTGDTIDSTSDEESIPILSEKARRAFGRIPAGKIAAGIYTAPGVSIGQILIGGVVTGRVQIDGSCNLFYAGQILTGDARGISDFEAPGSKANFFVNGDLRNLVSFNSIGTDTLDDPNLEETDYKTGFDLKVTGHLGQVVTKDSFLGATLVLNNPAFVGPGTAIPEVEVHAAPPPTTSDDTFFEGLDESNTSGDSVLAAPSLGDSRLFDNNTFDTAQYVGTARSIRNGGNIVSEIRGQLNGSNNVNDNVDYYAIGLMAGQTAQVRLTPDNGLFSPMQVAVFDPFGRMVASDYSNNDLASTQNLSFRFTAARPGAYRVAVAWDNDFNFNGVQDTNNNETSPPAKVGGPNNYTLLLSRVGDVGLGGIVASNNIGTTDFQDPTSFNPTFSFSFDLEQGDIGAIVCTAEAGGQGSDTIFSVVNSRVGGGSAYTVKHGNLRSMEADSIGILRDGEPVWGPDLKVPRGGVGLIRSRGTSLADDVLAVNLSLVTPFAGTFNPEDAIGFDYQLVDSGSIFVGNLMADRGIGAVRAPQFSTVARAPRLAVNADNRGNDGFIDLLDCTGSFGTLTAGGPAITTGNGGNVRYIHVDNLGSVFRDRFFGGGTGEVTTFPPGQPFRYTDDSGLSVKITPLPTTIGTTTGQLLNPNGIQVLTYGVRDKGGSVLIDARTYTQNFDTAGEVELEQGLLIDSGSSGGTGSAEIGSLNLIGTGSPVTFTTDGGLDNNANPIIVRQFNADATTTKPTTITIKGRRPIEVYDLSGTNLNTIENRTAGEMVNVEAQSIGTFTAQNIGFVRSKTNSEIGGATVRSNVFPFNNQRTLINVTGDVQSIRARGAVANVNVDGTIGEITANSDGVNDKTLIEGIDGPIVSTEHLLNVNIGEQLMPSGSGNYEQSGLFADGTIAKITNQGTAGSDIRGDIIVRSRAFLPAVQFRNQGNGQVTQAQPAVAGVGEINLINGAILESDILDVDDTTFDPKKFALEFYQPIVLAGPVSGLFPEIVHNIGDINIKGIGGIMGSWISADNMGSINISGGFGVFNSTIKSQASGTFDGIATDGYGLRLNRMLGGASLDHVIAKGTGRTLSTLTWTPSVRQSETQQFDPFTGRPLTRANDLHVFLNTTRANPVNKNTSVSGALEDTTITGSRDAGTITAFRILGNPGAFDTFSGGPLMRISFAENIAKLTATRDIDGLALVGGHVSLMQAGRNIANTSVEITGILSSIVAGGNIKSTTTVSVVGGEGRIDNITTGLALFGRVSAATKIGRLNVGTNFGSASVSSSNDISFVHINGSILSGATLRAADAINQLIIGHNIEEGGTVRAKRIISQSIGGQVRGDIIVG